MQNSTGYMQILGLGTDNNSVAAAIPSIYTFFNRDRFLFNCGEGLQRFAEERKVKVEHISFVPI